MAAVKRVPTRRNGYLIRLVSKIRPTSAKPNRAPAVVDDIKWDPPMQAPAKRIPGPMLRRSVDDAITRLQLIPVSAALPR